MRPIEFLEQRRLLAAQVSLSGRGTLIIDGDENDDRVEIVRAENNNNALFVRVLPGGAGDQGVDEGAGADAKASGTFNIRDVKRIAIYGQDGNDDVTLGNAIDDFTRPVSIFGGEGRDKLAAVTSGDLLMDGGADNDRVGASALLDYGGLRKNREVLDRYFGRFDVNGNNDDSVNGPDANDDGEVDRNVTLLGGTGDDAIWGSYRANIDGGDGTDTGYAAVAIDDDTRIPLSRIEAGIADFFGRLGSASVEGHDATVIGTSDGNGITGVDDLFNRDDNDDDDNDGGDDFAEDVRDFFRDVF